MIPVNLISSCSPDRAVFAVLKRCAGSEGELGHISAPAAPSLLGAGCLRSRVPALAIMLVRRRRRTGCGSPLVSWPLGSGVLSDAGLVDGVGAALLGRRRELLCLGAKGWARGGPWEGRGPCSGQASTGESRRGGGRVQGRVCGRLGTTSRGGRAGHHTGLWLSVEMFAAGGFGGVFWWLVWFFNF